MSVLIQAPGLLRALQSLGSCFLPLGKCGVPEGKISRVHIFRNAFVPLVQYIPNSILFTLMGSLYVESLYSIPGMGGLLVQVIKIQDNTMVQALVVIYAAISVVGLLLGDVLMALVDPRISFTKKEGSRA